MSRELDVEVAEKVMGWHVIEHDIGIPEVVKEQPSNKRQTIHELQAYSTDIAAAWMVVERVRRLGVTIRWNDSSKTWGAIIGGRDAADESLPLAICKASIAAMETSAKIQAAIEAMNESTAKPK